MKIAWKNSILGIVGSRSRLRSSFRSFPYLPQYKLSGPTTPFLVLFVILFFTVSLYFNCLHFIRIEKFTDFMQRYI